MGGQGVGGAQTARYLALLFFFAAAGVLLVAFLLLLNLTVAAGTINGLIFYANIVAANEALIFFIRTDTPSRKFGCAYVAAIKPGN